MRRSPSDIVLVEGNNELNVEMVSVAVLTYTCPYCLAPLYSLAEFFNHLETVHFFMPEDYFYCPYCGDDFSTMEAFFSHLEAQHIDDITAPPISPPDYLQNLSLYPTIVKQGEDATISGSFAGPFPDAYTSYRLAFNYYKLDYPGPRAYGKITSAGLFSLTLPTVDRHQHLIPPGVYPIFTTCAKRHDPPGGPILEGTIWLNVPTGLTITVLPAFDPWSYDFNGDGVIDTQECLAAVHDYQAGKITESQVNQVIALWGGGAAL